MDEAGVSPAGFTNRKDPIGKEVTPDTGLREIAAQYIRERRHNSGAIVAIQSLKADTSFQQMYERGTIEFCAVSVSPPCAVCK